jgi:hypothetical protein
LACRFASSQRKSLRKQNEHHDRTAEKRSEQDRCEQQVCEQVEHGLVRHGCTLTRAAGSNRTKSAFIPPVPRLIALPTLLKIGMTGHCRMLPVPHAAARYATAMELDAIAASLAAGPAVRSEAMACSKVEDGEGQVRPLRVERISIWAPIIAET